MRTRFLLVLALLLASAGCGSIRNILGIGSDGTLDLPLPRENPYSYNSFDDPQGLAGLQVTLSGAVERTFEAEDFPVEPFSVPEEGRVFVEVFLHGGPSTTGPIAGGRMDWTLEPDVIWSLRFDRSAYPPVASQPSPPGEPQVLCNWRGCRDYWRFDIVPRARNYEEETLWVALFGATPCPEGWVCD